MLHSCRWKEPSISQSKNLYLQCSTFSGGTSYSSQGIYLEERCSRIRRGGGTPYYPSQDENGFTFWSSSLQWTFKANDRQTVCYNLQMNGALYVTWFISTLKVNNQAWIYSVPEKSPCALMFSTLVLLRGAQSPLSSSSSWQRVC